MKKFIFILSLMFAIASCTCNQTSNVCTSVDSTEIDTINVDSVDSVLIDTISFDSVSC